MRTFKQLTKNDRLRIEVLIKAKHTPKEIAEIIQVHISTIYREIKRGRFEALNSDLTTEERYSPDIADEKYRENLAAKGADIKIGTDHKLANRIEEIIVNDGYSPAAALAKVKEENITETTICVTTLYSYIGKGVFLNLTNNDLPVKRNEKRNYKKVKKVQKRASKGESIEKRPEEIDDREEFGHWEMDSVIGQRGVSKKTLLVLTERKTREEMIILLKDHTAAAVTRALDKLEREMGGKKFREIFKSITVDNGSEFADYEGMERSKRNKKKRTKVYYCHPYSSWERGSNENQNKLIRRHIPKGTNFDDKTQKEIDKIAEWINNYPRRLFGYGTSGQLFAEEMEKAA